MKKFTALLIVFVMVFSMFTVTASAASSSSKGKIRVKKATYMKYKKAYNENKQLKRVIEQQKNTINSMKASANDKDSMNSWVWMNLKSMGIKYNNKTWTIPATMPETFIINGTTYKVVKE